MLHAAWTKWALDENLSYATNFWDYLASLEQQTGPVKKTIRNPTTGATVEQNVRYLKTESERRPYLLTVESGLLHDHNGDAYDTSRESTEASGPGWAIFVMDEKGNVYAGTHLFGVFHHSLFLGGAPAKAAGEDHCGERQAEGDHEQERTLPAGPERDAPGTRRVGRPGRRSDSGRVVSTRDGVR